MASSIPPPSGAVVWPRARGSDPLPGRLPLWSRILATRRAQMPACPSQATHSRSQASFHARKPFLEPLRTTHALYRARAAAVSRRIVAATLPPNGRCRWALRDVSMNNDLPAPAPRVLTPDSEVRTVGPRKRRLNCRPTLPLGEPFGGVLLGDLWCPGGNCASVNLRL